MENIDLERGQRLLKTANPGDVLVFEVPYGRGDTFLPNDMLRWIKEVRPRPWAIWDKCKPTASSEVFQILHIFEDFAWIFNQEKGFHTAPLFELTRPR